MVEPCGLLSWDSWMMVACELNAKFFFCPYYTYLHDMLCKYGLKVSYSWKRKLAKAKIPISVVNCVISGQTGGGDKSFFSRKSLRI
jgi:hypothetical protein